MSEIKKLSICQDCNTEIDEATENQGRKPRPFCESLRRSFQDSFSDAATVGTLVATKAYKGGLSRSKGLRFESKDGDSFSFDCQRLVELSQLVDHENNRYVKRVFDRKTGEVIREVDEPLAQHTGRGSAKKRNPKKS